MDSRWIDAAEPGPKPSSVGGEGVVVMRAPAPGPAMEVTVAECDEQASPRCASLMQRRTGIV